MSEDHGPFTRMNKRVTCPTDIGQIVQVIADVRRSSAQEIKSHCAESENTFGNGIDLNYFVDEYEQTGDITRRNALSGFSDQPIFCLAAVGVADE